MIAPNPHLHKPFRLHPGLRPCILSDLFVILEAGKSYACPPQNLLVQSFVGFILISVQPILDAVLYVRILLTALHFLEPSYLGVFFGHIFPQKLGTGIQQILEATTSKDYMGTRYGDRGFYFLMSGIISQFHIASCLFLINSHHIQIFFVPIDQRCGLLN